MKRLLFLATVLATHVAAHAADTAYTALRVFGKKEGDKALYRVVELRGSNGAPQPSAWKIVVDAPEARGGIREIDVKGGRIVGQRTPVSREVGPVMNFSQLNLDSDGAFTVVNQEAGKRRVPFDRLDYTLRSGSKGGVPVWEIGIFEKGARVGTMRIGADSGEVLERDFTPQQRYADDRAYVEPDRRPPPPPQPANRDVYDSRYDGPARDDGSEYDRHRANVSAFADRVGRHFQRRGRQIENFFTGKESDDRDR